uniref:Interleukin-6 n=2 Tax=Periophthalmus magnuspinnatus TaxID=409849 RepID=A0A3B4BKS2_9GOBI
MPPTNLYAALLSVLLMVAALMDPVAVAPLDLPTEAPSGEGDTGATDLLSDSPMWRTLLDATHQHKQEFNREFTGSIEYLHLDNFNIVSFPEDCRNTSINMEGCLRRLVRGLLVYQVLLKHVEREYPNSQVLPNIKYFSSLLISATRQKMRKPDAVKALSRTQEDSLLKEVDHFDMFNRKMFAHNILRKLHEFLRDIQVSIKRIEKRPGTLL